MSDTDERLWRADEPGKMLMEAACRVSERKFRRAICACLNRVGTFYSPGTATWEAAERSAAGFVSGPGVCADASAHVTDYRSRVSAVCRLATQVEIAIIRESLARMPPAQRRDEPGPDAPVIKAEYASLVREVFGNPFRPLDFAPWRTDTAVTLARTMYDQREFGAMPILADALQDAGCDSDEVLRHCRDATQLHVRGCWVVDGVLGLS